MTFLIGIYIFILYFIVGFPIGAIIYLLINKIMRYKGLQKSVDEIKFEKPTDDTEYKLEFSCYMILWPIALTIGSLMILLTLFYRLIFRILERILK